MSERVKGTVTGVGKGKFSYFVILDESGFYWNTKFEPKCGKGDVVGIEGVRKDDKRGQIQKLKVLESNSNGYEASAPSKPSGGYSSGGGGGDRQDSIVWQSSRKDALVLAGLLLSNEAYAIKGKPDAKQQQIEALVDEITVRYFESASDPKSSDAYKAASERASTDDDDFGADDDGGEDDWSDGGDEW